MESTGNRFGAVIIAAFAIMFGIFAGSFFGSDQSGAMLAGVVFIVVAFVIALFGLDLADDGGAGYVDKDTGRSSLIYDKV